MARLRLRVRERCARASAELEIARADVDVRRDLRWAMECQQHEPEVDPVRAAPGLEQVSMLERGERLVEVLGRQRDLPDGAERVGVRPRRRGWSTARPS